MTCSWPVHDLFLPAPLQHPVHACEPCSWPDPVTGNLIWLQLISFLIIKLVFSVLLSVYCHYWLFIWDWLSCRMLQVHPPLWSHRWLRLMYPRQFWGLRWSWMALTTSYGHKYFFVISIVAQNTLQFPPATIDLTYATRLSGDYCVMTWLLNSLDEKSSSVRFMTTVKMWDTWRWCMEMKESFKGVWDLWASVWAQPGR